MFNADKVTLQISQFAMASTDTQHKLELTAESLVTFSPRTSHSAMVLTDKLELTAEMPDISLLVQMSLSAMVLTDKPELTAEMLAFMLWVTKSQFATVKTVNPELPADLPVLESSQSAMELMDKPELTAQKLALAPVSLKDHQTITTSRLMLDILKMNNLFSGSTNPSTEIIDCTRSKIFKF
jgi:hypothetical protein